MRSNQVPRYLWQLLPQYSPYLLTLTCSPNQHCLCCDIVSRSYGIVSLLLSVSKICPWLMLGQKSLCKNVSSKCPPKRVWVWIYSTKSWAKLDRYYETKFKKLFKIQSRSFNSDSCKWNNDLNTGFIRNRSIVIDHICRIWILAPRLHPQN